MDNKTTKSTTKTNVSEPKSVYNLTWTDKFEIDDINNRRLYINTDIDECVIDSVVYHILRYNREDKGIKREDRTPIILYLNSPGGNVADGYGLIDAITCSETPIYTVNLALCASMGFLIFLAGEKRFSMPRAEFLMHDGSTFAFDSTAKMKDRMEFVTGQLEEMTKKYILSRTSMDEGLYDEKYRIEWYMLPDEAKEHGIVTNIIGKDCSINEVL